MTYASLSRFLGRTGLLPRRSPTAVLSALLRMTTILLVPAMGLVSADLGGEGRDITYRLDMTKCAGFTPADAAQVLGLPASSLTAKSEKKGASFWICTFSGAGGKGLSFSVSIAKSAAQAAGEMERLRSDLEIAAETAPFKDKLPSGAYSDIMGLGDDALWTDVNGTLTARKGNIVLQVLSPPGKREQIKVARAFLAKF